MNVNKHYDEAVDVPDSEDIVTPRVPASSRSLHHQGAAPLTALTVPPKGSRKAMDQKNRSKMFEDESDDGRSTAQATPVSNAQPPSSLLGGSGLGPRAARLGQVGGGGLPAATGGRFHEEIGSSEDDDDDDGGDDEDEDAPEQLEGAYNPADYENLAVSEEIKELFQYIQRYTPQAIELETRLKPFIPDFIPAVGDIDAFLKVPRPDLKPDGLGLLMLDEPCAKQSDPTVLDLQLRALSKQTTSKQMVVRSLEDVEKQPRAIDNWIKSISDLHRSKPPPTVHYNKNMPDIETLMQEWPPEFEELLKEAGCPTAELDCSLTTYVDMICGLLDIPVYNNRIQSLHLLFTLYSEFRNSQHFGAMTK